MVHTVLIAFTLNYFYHFTVPGAPVLDMSTLQALALAKAQALSLALKSSTAAASASVSAPVPAGGENKTEQDKLKSLVDQIPTAK